MKKRKGKAKKKGKGKAKGSAFERKIAKALSVWLTDGQSRTELIRSVLSGGWGARQGEPWRQVGDLAPNGPVGEQFRRRWAVECKHHKKINLWSLWTRNSKDTIAGWWKHLNKEIIASESAVMRPMLIFHGNFMPIMVATPYPSLEIRADKEIIVAWLGMRIFTLQELLSSDPALFLE